MDLILRVIIIGLFLCILSIGTQADELSDELLTLGYVEKEVPKIGSDIWAAANRSFPSFYVEKEKSLIVRKLSKDEENSSKSIYDAGTVKYIGIDHGEFGGGLYINEYKKDSEPFFSANVRALIPVENDLYIISGLAHMSFSGGAIHVIRNYKKPSKPEQVTLLPDAP